MYIQVLLKTLFVLLQDISKELSTLRCFNKAPEIETIKSVVTIFSDSLHNCFTNSFAVPNMNLNPIHLFVPLKTAIENAISSYDYRNR